MTTRTSVNATRTDASCAAPAGAVHVEPDVEDARSQGRYREEIDGPELVQRLHERERHADRDRRACERHRDREEACDRAAPEGTARLEQPEALLEERGACKEIDVGVEHQRQHDGRSAERADFGEPVVARGRPSEHRSQRALHVARILELIGDHEREDVARDREWKQQRPGQNPAAREAVHGDQPCGRGADDDGSDRHPRHQPERVSDVYREHG